MARPIGGSRTTAATLGLVVFSVLGASPVYAHSEFAGVGSFWNGALHLFVSPEEAIALFALGFAIPRLGAERSPKALMAHLVALSIGLIVGLIAISGDPQALRALPLILPGVLLIDPVALHGRFPLVLHSTAALATGFACGAAIPEEGAPWVFATGMLFGALVLTGGALLTGERAQAPWVRIATRIAGSWMIAIGVMLLGAYFAFSDPS